MSVVNPWRNGWKPGRIPYPDEIETHYQETKISKILVEDLAKQIQRDLVDIGKYKNQNKVYYWNLTAVEILSRYAFGVPVYRNDTKNMTKAESYC